MSTFELHMALLILCWILLFAINTVVFKINNSFALEVFAPVTIHLLTNMRNSKVRIKICGKLLGSPVSDLGRKFRISLFKVARYYLFA